MLTGALSVAACGSGSQSVPDAGDDARTDSTTPVLEGGRDATPDGTDGGAVGSTDAGTPPPVCGNGRVEPGEACDGQDLAGLVCASLRVGSSGSLACSADCRAFVTSGCASGGRAIAAATCEQPAVQAAIDLAQDGDTVTIPAGHCTWTTPVSASGKSLRIAGAGAASTVISASVDQALALDAPAGKAIEFSGVRFQDAVGENGIVSVSGGTRSFRIHHVEFVSNGSNRAIRTFGATYGVIDHCTTSGPIIEFATVDDDDWVAWQRPHSFGMVDAVFIEDNTIAWSSGYEGEPVFDSERGGRLVFRHNQVTDAIPGNHGFDTGNTSSALSAEVYSNTFTIDAGFNAGGATIAFMGLVRGGTGVWYDNTWNVADAIWAHDDIALSIFRIELVGTSEESHLSWPTCDGTTLGFCSTIDRDWSLQPGADSPTACASDAQCPSGSTCRWKLCSVSRMNLCSADADCPAGERCSSSVDGNGPDGSPCFQQPGYGTGMQSVPMYEWNNVLNGAQFGPGHDVNFGGGQPQIVEGRDFFNNTHAPGYVPYVYPHPLVSAAP